MKTATGNVEEMANDFLIQLEELLSHSTIYLWNTPDSPLIGFGGDYAYRQLDEVGLRLQTRVLDQYRRFY